VTPWGDLGWNEWDYEETVTWEIIEELVRTEVHRQELDDDNRKEAAEKLKQASASR